MSNQEFLHNIKNFQAVKKRYGEILNTAFSIIFTNKILKGFGEPKRIMQQVFGDTKLQPQQAYTDARLQTT